MPVRWQVAETELRSKRPRLSSGAFFRRGDALAETAPDLLEFMADRNQAARLLEQQLAEMQASRDVVQRELEAAQAAMRVQQVVNRFLKDSGRKKMTVVWNEDRQEAQIDCFD